MKKRIRIMISLVLVLLMAGCLTACGTGTEITTTPKKAVFEMEGLDQGEEVETTALFNFKEGRIKVELESGTVDITIINIIPDVDDDDIYTELDIIYEGKGLKDGDDVEFSGINRDIVIRMEGDNAVGKVTVTSK